MRLQLTWEDVNTGQVRSPTLETPIAFGREFAAMPTAMKGISIRRMVLNSDQVDDFHALLIERNGQLMISDRQAGRVTKINGVALQPQAVQFVNDGDRITIGPFEIALTILAANRAVASEEKTAENPEINPEINPETSPETNPETVPKINPDLVTAPAEAAAREEAVPAFQTSGNGFGADGRCHRKVGFLFKRRCDRTTPEGCPDCRNGQVDPSCDHYEDDYA
ncbi:MAG: FHA domain-containing protein, partial [Phormidesmis sp. RL_2_1]|nr:FHA domain-containing protein [Phormidesmis sp. RL_2_1]